MSTPRRPPLVPSSSSMHSPTQEMATKSANRLPFERMLDRRLDSVSTFVSSTQSFGASMMKVNLRKQEESKWCEEMPQAVLFPTNKPSSRADAVVLDQWITKSLTTYAQRFIQNQKAGSNSDETNFSKAVEELVPILSIGLHEVVRQVTQQCLQRGVVLEKLWRTYVELFERALGKVRASLKRHREKTQRVDADLAETRNELTELQAKHPEQISKLSRTLEGKFAQRQEELQEMLRGVNQENAALEDHLKEQFRGLQSWFPLYTHYKDTELRHVLEKVPPLPPSQPSPEARIAADYQRILWGMSVDSRRRVGFFVASLLGLRGGTQVVSEMTEESLMVRKEHNAWKIERLQARIVELKTAIAAKQQPVAAQPPAQALVEPSS